MNRLRAFSDSWSSFAVLFALGLCTCIQSHDDLIGDLDTHSTRSFDSQDTASTNPSNTTTSTTTTSTTTTKTTTDSTSEVHSSQTTSTGTTTETTTTFDTGDRIEAARNVALTNPACTKIHPFYWEIGDATHSIVGESAGGTEPARETELLIASASKWLYSATVVQHLKGQLSAADLDGLRFTSGYVNFNTCLALKAETIDTCLNRGTNGDRSDDAVGHFYYNGGHMQRHAHDLGWGEANNAIMADYVNQKLELQTVLAYSQPQPAGGVRWTAAGYAEFLGHLLNKRLLMADLLGSSAVCTNPMAQGCDALSTPIPMTESWHYSLGHWVEDDPKVGDGTWSSPGKFGFYPWIDVTKTYYGILAREDRDNALAAMDSVLCGRAIRAAWLRAD